MRLLICRSKLKQLGLKINAEVQNRRLSKIIVNYNSPPVSLEGFGGLSQLK